MFSSYSLPTNFLYSGVLVAYSQRFDSMFTSYSDSGSLLEERSCSRGSE